MGLTNQLHQPEYTGENRCIPCTAVNIIIAAAVSALAAVASTLVGVGVFTFSLTIIYLRGYLIPGTPTLTKRYFPDRVLRWFDKGTNVPKTDEAMEIDPEQVLLDVHAIEPCRRETDLCLTTDFQKAWRESVHTAREHGLDEDLLVGVLDVSSEDNRVTVEQHDDAFVARADNTVIGQWSSQAAAIADVAAATELDDRSSTWSELSPAETAQVLMSLRVFIEKCPKCDGPVRMDQEVVESCCRSYDVVASNCQDCGARLFEMEWNDTSLDAS